MTEHPRHRSSFLLRQFYQFYGEVVRLGRLIEYTAPPPAAAAAAAAAGASPGEAVETVSAAPPASAAPPRDNPVVNGVWQQLLTLLERQAMDAAQTGGAFAFEVYREAQYVMAALADEIFLHMDWEGRATWPLLEARLFQSHIAGEAVFERLDRLLQRRDPFYIDLASVYFVALALGFQGKYRGMENDGHLDQYRRQLFVMIHRRNPRLFDSTGELFPQALQHTLDKVPVKRLPPERVWLLLIAAVLVVWMAASQYAWSSATGEVASLIRQIMVGSAAGTGGAQ